MFYLGIVVILPLPKEIKNNDRTIELTLERKWVVDVGFKWVKCNEMGQVHVRKYSQFLSDFAVFVLIFMVGFVWLCLLFLTGNRTLMQSSWGRNKVYPCIAGKIPGK